jgi:hypothetical protein
MRRVVVESPFAGKTKKELAKNLRYARACLRDCLKRGEAPFASHLLYTQKRVLKDTIPEERKLGMEAGFVWGNQAEATVVYNDLGVSDGMQEGIKRADKVGRPVEFRNLKKWHPKNLSTSNKEEKCKQIIASGV